MQKLRTAVKNHSTILFLLLAYGITWLLWAPSIAASRGLLPFDLPDWASLPGNFGPALAAILALAINGGKSAVQGLLRRLFQWRLPVVLYFWGLIFPLLVNAGLIALFGLMIGLTPNLGPRTFISLLSAFLVWAVVGGPLGEEPGWRGFLLPKLLEKHRALPASLILAAIWFAWHLPRYLDPQVSGGGPAMVLLFGLQVVAFAVLHTWIYANAQGSLLLLTLFHASINTLGYMAPIVYPSAAPEMIAAYYGPVMAAYFSALVIWAVLVVLIYGPTSLRRKGRGEAGLPPGSGFQAQLHPTDR